jgi:hypothetical protein
MNITLPDHDDGWHDVLWRWKEKGAHREMREREARVALEQRISGSVDAIGGQPLPPLVEIAHGATRSDNPNRGWESQPWILEYAEELSDCYVEWHDAVEAYLEAREVIEIITRLRGEIKQNAKTGTQPS